MTTLLAPPKRRRAVRHTTPTNCPRCQGFISPTRCSDQGLVIDGYTCINCGHLFFVNAHPRQHVPVRGGNG